MQSIYYQIIKFMTVFGIYILFEEYHSSSADVILLASSKICVLWLFKKNKKDIPQKIKIDKRSLFRTLSKNNEEELLKDNERQEIWDTQDIDLRDKKEFWEYMNKVKEIFENKEANNDAQKTAAIYQISRFYNPQHIDVISHIHSLYKECLDEFWKCNEENTKPDIPVYIEFIYHLIKHISHQQLDGKNFFNKMNKMSLGGFKLKFANLSYANFMNQNLICANLSNANLFNSDSVNADWENTNLTSINLSKADLSNANMLESDLTRANLAEADLSNTILNHANMSYAKLNNAILPRADLTFANITHANLIYANLALANLAHADLSYTNMSKTNLIAADMSHSNLSHANLSDANLSCAILNHADLIETDLTRANLSGTNLKHAKNLNNTNLQGAMYCESDDFITQFPNNFNPEKHGMVLVNKFSERIKKAAQKNQAP